MTAPPGGIPSIGFGGESAAAPLQPKNSASAAKARDLSTNPLAPLAATTPPAAEGAVVEQMEERADAPRPRGAPNRAKAPPGGHSNGPFW